MPLFDPDSTFSHIYVDCVPQLGKCSEPLTTLLRVSTLLGDSLVVDQVHRSFLVTIPERDSRANLILLDILDFNTILGIEWLYPDRTVLIDMLRPLP